MSSASLTASFLPPWLRRSLSVRGHVRPWVRDAAGVAVWVDLVEFTRLVEHHVAEGAAGVERLSDLLDAYFRWLFDVVESHGGEVGAIVGDAALVLFESSSPDDAASTALSCATSLQRDLGAQPFPGHVSLSHRVSVASGVLRHVCLGSDDVALSFVAGSAVEEVGALHKTAHPGAVHASRDVLDGARRATATRLTATLAESECPEHSVRAYLPGALVARLAAGHGAWVAELRVTSVLFVELPTPSEAEEVSALQETVLVALGAVARFDGCAYQLVLDDKGLVFVAIWGLASQAHEDDATRAVRAGLSMLEQLRLRGVSARAGVSSGRSLCGVYGDDRRRHFACLGSVMNLAARLMTSAQGVVLCDAETSRLASGKVTFAPAETITVKGRSGTMEVHAASGERTSIELGATPSAAPGLGRESQVAELTRALDRLLDGEASFVRVVAEAGMGKTTLVRDFLREAARRGVRALSTQGDAVEQSALTPWRPVFEGLLGGGGAGERDAGERLRTWLVSSPSLLEMLPLLQAIVPLGLADSDAVNLLPTVGRMEHLQAIVVAVLTAAAAERPTVLVFDDVHWMDSPTCALLLAVATRVPQLLVLCASRPFDPAERPDLRRLHASHPGATDLDLGPLRADVVGQVVARRLGVSIAPPALVELIAERTEGHPMHTEEVTQALVERGLVEVREGVATAPALSRDVLSTLPDSLQRVLATRIDALAPSEQLVVKVASVFGRAFRIEALREVFPVREDVPRLDALLSTLLARRLINAEGPSNARTYVFRHALTQRAAYETLLFTQRRLLHRAVAEVLERGANGDAAPTPAVLAHHWTLANDAERAVPHLERAARDAAVKFANREAAVLYEELLRQANALATSVPVSRRAEWESERCEAYIKLGDRERSVAALERSLVLRGVAVPKSTSGALLRTVGHLMRQGVQRLLAPRFFGNDDARREHWAAVATCMQSATELWWHRQDLARMVWATWAGVNLGELGGESPGIAKLYASCCVSAGFAGWHGAATWYFARAHSIAAQLGDEATRAYVNVACGIYDNAAGRWDRSASGWSSASAYYERVGDRYRAIEGRAALMFQEQQLGSFDRVLTLADETIALARFEGGVLGRVQGASAQAAALVALGRANAACADTIESALADEPPGREQVIGCATLARTWLALGDESRAAAWAAKAVGLAELNPPLVYFVAPSLSLLVEACCLLGLDARGAARAGWVRRASTVSRQLGMLRWTVKSVAPAWHVATGQVALLDGDTRRARQQFERAHAVADRFRNPYDARRAKAGLQRGLDAPRIGA